jgi:Mannitol-1-phosphate/altronate dehydrogenases
MKKAVMYGAGNIGRGFIGKTLSDSGYEVCFLDIVPEIIDAFNINRQYRVKIVSNDGEHCDLVKNVYAVDARTKEAARQIADCDLMATAVGVNILPHIAGAIAEGVKLRMQLGRGPLNIILAENQLEADKLMRGYIYQALSNEQKEWADENLGLVEASIGRMVPPLCREECANDPLLIAVEEYSELPVDKDAFKGEIPQLVGLIPYSPFGFYIKRKLFIHNMGHALCAYFGWQKQYDYIWQAVEDNEIRAMAQQAMVCVAKALCKEYNASLSDITDYIKDLLCRFKNKALKDTIVRVGADPIRKLRKNDRLVGAMLYCLAYNQNSEEILKGIIAAMHFDNIEDQFAVKLQHDLKEEGLDFVIRTYLDISIDSELALMIKKKA